jgi:hypothetical protein
MAQRRATTSDVSRETMLAEWKCMQRSSACSAPARPELPAEWPKPLHVVERPTPPPLVVATMEAAERKGQCASACVLSECVAERQLKPTPIARLSTCSGSDAIGLTPALPRRAAPHPSESPRRAAPPTRTAEPVASHSLARPSSVAVGGASQYTPAHPLQHAVCTRSDTAMGGVLDTACFDATSTAKPNSSSAQVGAKPACEPDAPPVCV